MELSFPNLDLPDELRNVTFMVYPCQVDFYVSMPENPGDEPIYGIEAEIFENATIFPWSMYYLLLIFSKLT